MCIFGPGTLAENRSETPSSGWIFITSTLLSIESPASPKSRCGMALEADRDLGVLARQAFAAAQIERHVGPAPVVDEELHRRVGVGVRFRVDAGLFAIAGYRLAADAAGVVLSARRI